MALGSMSNLHLTHLVGVQTENPYEQAKCNAPRQEKNKTESQKSKN